MFKKVFRFSLVILMLLLMVIGILTMCGITIDTNNIYHNEIILACIVPANLCYYLLLKSFGTTTRKMNRWFGIANALTILAVLEYFLFADSSKHLLRAFALFANGIFIALDNSSIKIIVLAALGRGTEDIVENNKLGDNNE